MKCDHRRTCPVHNRKAVKRMADHLEAAQDNAHVVWAMNLAMRLMNEDGVPAHLAARVLPGMWGIGT